MCMREQDLLVRSLSQRGFIHLCVCDRRARKKCTRQQPSTTVTTKVQLSILSFWTVRVYGFHHWRRKLARFMYLRKMKCACWWIILREVLQFHSAQMMSRLSVCQHQKIIWEFRNYSSTGPCFLKIKTTFYVLHCITDISLVVTLFSANNFTIPVQSSTAWLSPEERNRWAL